MLFRQACDASLWKKLKEDVQGQWVRDQLECMKANYCSNPIEALKFSEYKVFSHSGSRKEFEASYFARRGRLNTLAGLALIYDNDDNYLHDLEDAIWAICDEYTWALPAHTERCSVDEIPFFIDLFAAETGFALAEIYYLLGDRFDLRLVERIKYEVGRRIINPFESKPFWWEKIENNWAAVCAGSVAAAFMYLEPGRFPGVQARIEDAMECFLSSYKDDGVCREGIGYWNYGFGFFVYYAQLLKEFTDGKMDWFKNEKVECIAKFQQNAFLQGNVVIAFADVSVNDFKYDVGLTHFLNTIYKTTIPPKEYTAGLQDDFCHRWARFIRSIVWFSGNEHCSGLEKGNVHFKESEIFIVKNDGFAIVAKCGCNEEPHNHNDVGSFMFVSDNRQILCDLGSGEYTRAYFQPETRYDFLVNSSRGHNVPIINGQYQKDGAEFVGKILTMDTDVFEIDIAGAYGIQSLKRLLRRFEVRENAVDVAITYEFESAPDSIVERLVSMIEPDIQAGSIRIGNTMISYPCETFKCSCHSVEYQNHRGSTMTAYLIDLKMRNLAKTIKTGFTISI